MCPAGSNSTPFPFFFVKKIWRVEKIPFFKSPRIVTSGLSSQIRMLIGDDSMSVGSARCVNYVYMPEIMASHAQIAVEAGTNA